MPLTFARVGLGYRAGRCRTLSSKERETVFERYTADKVESQRKRAKKKAKKLKDGYLDLIAEAKMSRHSRFADFKVKSFRDPRYKAVTKMLDKTKWFNEYINALKQKKKAEGSGAVQKKVKEVGVISSA
jgi:hypothetical protein